MAGKEPDDRLTAARITAEKGWGEPVDVNRGRVLSRFCAADNLKPRLPGVSCRSLRYEIRPDLAVPPSFASIRICYRVALTGTH